MILELQISLAFSHALLDAIDDIDQCDCTKLDFYYIATKLCMRMEDMTLRFVAQAKKATPITPTKEF